MTRPHEKADVIEQKAAEWLVKVENEGTPESAKALAAWLAAHERHRAAFLRISIGWRRADALRRLADPLETPDPDLLAPERPPACESITEPPGSEEHRAPAARSRVSATTRTFRFAVAAALAALFFGVMAFFTQGRLETSQAYATAVGEFRRIPLPDGSAITLNTDTQVRVSYSNERRKIELLRGEAQFEVVRDATRPFLVRSGRTAIYDIGTVFVVRRYTDDAVDVLVSEGRVAINPPSQFLVSAGEMALVRGEQITLRAVDDISRRVAWLEGRVIFNDETLARAIAEMNRYNHHQLVIADPAVASIRVGGAFRTTKPDRLATALEKTFGLKATTQGNETRISRGTP